MSTGQPRDLSKKQQELRATTAERLEAIVEAAERAAESVIDDAEEQARRHLAQARAEADRVGEGNASGIAELLETLLGQATTLRQEAERLQATLEAAQAQLQNGDTGEQQQQPPPRLRAIGGAVEPEPEPEPAAEDQRSDAAGARLLATQLAVSGSSREEIEERLRNRFEIEDTKAILDAILGPEG